MNNLIGVAGKINSGKDLVGKILQYLESEAHLKYSFEKYCTLDLGTFGVGYYPTYEIKKFADKLKEIVCLLIGCTREQLEDREFKETPLGKEWDIIVNLKGELVTQELNPNIFKERKITPRLLLQLLGTDCGRKIIHPNIWVNALFADYKPTNSIIEKSNTYVDNRLTHGLNKTRIFRIYHNIKQRCNNPKHPRYSFYGGKGIKLCKEWENSLESFVNWSISNNYSEELTIDRKDNEKDYSPENCRWVSYSLQSINQGLRKDNTSGYKGVSKDKHGWRASIQTKGVRKFLGYFDSAEAASEAYEEAFIERENIYLEEEKANLVYPMWCITDVRFPNEANAIKERGGIVIRVNRPCKECGSLTGHKMDCNIGRTEHESEYALDRYENFDYVIDNDGTIEELLKKIKNLNLCLKQHG